MAEKNKYSDETKAAVMASLLAGQSVSSVAREYEIPKGTVSGWKNYGIDRASKYSSIVDNRAREIAALVESKIESKSWGVEFHNKSEKETHVYFVKDSLLNLIKIGIAKHLGARLSSMQSGCPQDLILVGYIKTHFARRIESELHDKYSDKNYRREWFELSQNDILFVIKKYNGVLVSQEISDLG